MKVTTEGRPAGAYAMNYGVTDALAPFPLHSLVNVMSATINNNAVYFNVQETLPLLLRMVDPEEFAKYDCMTPTALDYLADYDDALYPMDFVLKPVAGNLLTNAHPTMYSPADVD
ncbi:MAG: phage major capsid domain-containing protein, partial [Candidatus Fonsibacter sp.]